MKRACVVRTGSAKLMRVVRDYANLSSAELAELERELAALRTLEQVVRWGVGRTARRTVEEVIVQDEYTHDVLMPLDGQRWLIPRRP